MNVVTRRLRRRGIGGPSHRLSPHK